LRGRDHDGFGTRRRSQDQGTGREAGLQGYYDYPCVLCTSVNEEIVHGIPSPKRVLKAGDIVSIDCGVVMDGYYGDAALLSLLMVHWRPKHKSCSK